MDYTEMYYELNHGIYPFETEEAKNKTQKVIDYLIDAKISEKDIFRIIEEAPKADYLKHEDLPEWLWENSLLNKNTFYYHNVLQIRSKSPKMNMESLEVESVPFYLEMQIKFTTHDLLLYFYKKANTEYSFIDEKKDIGAIAHLLNQYSKIGFIDSVDFMLALIDYATTAEDCSTSTIFQLDSKYRSEVFELLKKRTAEANANHINKVVYR